MLDHRDLAERHFPAVRRADAHVLEGTDGSPSLTRVAHHDPDVIASSLNPLGLFAVERLPNLATQVCEREAKDFRFRPDPKLDLLLPLAERVSDLVHPRVPAETTLDLRRNGSELVEVWPGELNVDVVPRREYRRVELQLDGLRN